MEIYKTEAGNLLIAKKLKKNKTEMVPLRKYVIFFYIHEYKIFMDLASRSSMKPFISYKRECPESQQFGLVGVGGSPLFVSWPPRLKTIIEKLY